MPADPARIITYLKTHPNANIRRYEILHVLIDFAKDVNGSTPTELGWWKLFNAQAPKYGYLPMHRSTFYDHIRKLVDEGYVERRRGVICIIDANWEPPPMLPILKEKDAPP